ncbi:hypothetical protein C7C46_25165 [Streptomyces tateyamensis]|uniref:Uncharacterized protein n=1 Tax=Streptomyces tateyamensis TaxID=565073 RepID=A0A2V4N3F9_9ACTN|nr:hypothetical protein C7C46_25165 [Streptomyces tateyamensis]
MEPGEFFRELWVEGVKKHFPGEPKAGYVVPWAQTPAWERASAAAVHQLVADLVRLSEGGASKLSREQKGRFVALCWTAQIYRHFEDPKPGYVADWEDLPAWQRETDSDIFERIEQSL